MNKIFLIGDTHFGHTKILEFESQARPFATVEEHNEKLIENWNRVVKTKDTVWHLGDVLFGIENFDCVSRLNGYKHLIMGNHDHYPMEEYQKYFNKIVGAHKLANYLLSHVPVHPSQKYRFKGNIHGHMHSNKLDDPWYINVSAEQINLTPIELNELLNR